MKNIFHFGKKRLFIAVSVFLLFVMFLPLAFSSNSVSTNSMITIDSCDLVCDSNSVVLSDLSDETYNLLQLSAKGLSKEVFDYAVSGLKYLNGTGVISNDQVITIVDLTKPSSFKRLFVVDLKKKKLLFNTYVAHGVNSGTAFASRFSNAVESNQSSLGFYKTQSTYLGGNGYSLHLKGLEKGFNDNAEKRAIVLHGADYVNETFIKARGYIGRSFGCPSVPVKLHKPIIDRIKNGTCLFIYSNDKKYLSRSSIIAPINLANAHSGKLSLKS